MLLCLGSHHPYTAWDRAALSWDHTTPYVGIMLCLGITPLHVGIMLLCLGITPLQVGIMLLCLGITPLYVGITLLCLRITLLNLGLIMPSIWGCTGNLFAMHHNSDSIK